MKVLKIIFLVLFMVSCSKSEPKVVVPTPTSAQEALVPIGPDPVKKDNFLVTFDESTFGQTVKDLISEVAIYNQKIGYFLSVCEIGVVRNTGYDVLSHGDGGTCLILFVPESMTGKEMLKEFAPPKDSNATFTVALTKDIVGPNYPFIFIGEGQYDFYYLTRVLAHEAFHAMSIKNQTECTSTPMCEEVNAYQIQFSILEKMYGPEIPNSVQAYALTGVGSPNFRALDMENYLYQVNKKGDLGKELISMNYGDGTQ